MLDNQLLWWDKISAKSTALDQLKRSQTTAWAFLSKAETPSASGESKTKWNYSEFFGICVKNSKKFTDLAKGCEICFEFFLKIHAEIQKLTPPFKRREFFWKFKQKIQKFTKMREFSCQNRFLQESIISLWLLHRLTCKTRTASFQRPLDLSTFFSYHLRTHQKPQEFFETLHSWWDGDATLLHRGLLFWLSSTPNARKSILICLLFCSKILASW